MSRWAITGKQRGRKASIVQIRRVLRRADKAFSHLELSLLGLTILTILSHQYCSLDIALWMLQLIYWLLSLYLLVFSSW